jgi:hypothetical protein
MTPTLFDLALKAGFSDPIEGWMGEAYEERLEAFAKLIIDYEIATKIANVTGELTNGAEVEEAAEKMCEAITAIKQARSAPVQEPVAWQVMVEDEAMEEFSVKDAAYDWCVQQKLAGSPYSYWIRPLYTTPTAQEFVCSTGLCHYKANKENT